MAKQGLLRHLAESTVDYFRGQDLDKQVDAKIAEISAEDELAKADPAVAFNASPGLFSLPLAGMTDRKFGSGVSFETLRHFSVVYDVARMCINHRKRQISNLDWNIVPKDDDMDSDAFRTQIDELEAFFNEPFPNTDFNTFTDKILEDLLVFDAATLWKDKTFGGKLFGLMNVDAATIRIKVAEDGLLPEPPNFAYQQVINGTVHEEYTTDEMYYKIVNPRTNTPYGLSPIESLIIGVDAALRSQTYNLSVLKEGNVPEGFFTLPKEWKSEQISKFQTWFDTLIAGNPTKTTRLKFMPDGKYFPTKKPSDMQFVEFEKWLLIKTCGMFDVQPSDIGYTETVNKSTQEGQQQQGNERGLVPTARFLKRFYNEIIRKDFGYTDLVFEWQGLQATDEDFELRRDQTMVERGGISIDEWRVKQGLEPWGIEATQRPIFLTAGGVKLLDTVTVESAEAAAEAARIFAEGSNNNNNQPPKDKKKDDEEDDSSKAEISELRKWRKKSLNHFGKGGTPEFTPVHLNKAICALITARLGVAQSKDEIRKAFDPFIMQIEEESIVKDAAKLNVRVAKHKRSRYAQTGSDTK